MKLLAEIIRKKGMRTQGKTIYREAVRAIIIKGNLLLMVHSSLNGDFKFPGGGVKDGESFQTALKREILEECGARLVHVGQAFGKIIEYDLPSDEEFEVFKMTSYYYLCQVHESMEKQKLDQYEIDLGFEPSWISIEEAIQTNQRLNKIDTAAVPEWVERETFVLEQLQQQFLNTEQTTG